MSLRRTPPPAWEPPPRVAPPLKLHRPVPTGRPNVEREPLPDAPERCDNRGRSRGRARPDEPMALRCEARTPACSGPPVDRHHRLLRKHGGCDCPENTLDLCDPCHDYVHAEPRISYARGWLLRSHENPHEG